VLFPRVAPRAILPEVFWKPYARSQEDPSIKRSAVAVRVPTDVTNAATLTEALFKLDPCEWRGRHDEWLALAMASKAVGISCRDFVRWSTSDPHYARDEREIERKWHSFEGKHGGALYKALAEHGIKVGAKGTKGRAELSLIAGVSVEAPATFPTEAKPSPKSDLIGDSRRLIRWLNREPSEDRLFYVACIFAERGMLQKVAEDVLRSNCDALRKSLGADEFTYQIARAFTHIAARGVAP
jgi:hypothetical protein